MNDPFHETRGHSKWTVEITSGLSDDVWMIKWRVELSTILTGII